MLPLRAIWTYRLLGRCFEAVQGALVGVRFVFTSNHIYQMHSLKSLRTLLIWSLHSPT